MESPWISEHRQPAVERPWAGMALLAAIPLLALVLIRMLWSGSSLWFLTVGLILLGVAAVIFLARRPQDHEYSRQALAPESNRVPLVLAGVGVLFLAMLLLPNFAGGGDGARPETFTQDQTSGAGLTSEVASGQRPAAQQPAAQQPAAQQPAVQQPAAEEPATNQDSSSVAPVVPEGSQTYIVQDGDTLWDIALQFDTTVDAIIAANGLDNPEDIQIDQELVIPPPEAGAADSGADAAVPADDGTADETAQ